MRSTAFDVLLGTCSAISRMYCAPCGEETIHVRGKCVHCQARIEVGGPIPEHSPRSWTVPSNVPKHWRRRRITEKRCTRCKQTKPREQYSPDARSLDGLASWCKACARDYSRARREWKRQQAMLNQSPQDDAHGS
jgi:hypothetical protein